MARIVVHSMAHRGDVYPYVPIASELCRRGHEVTYVVPREFHPAFSAEPFRCVHSGTDFSPMELDQHGAYIARWGNKLGGGALLPLYFGKFTVPHLDALFGAVDAALADADLLVSHPAAAIVGSMSCERRGLPWVVGDLFPMLVPTATAPPVGLPNLGPAINRATWKLGRSRLAVPLTSRSGFVEFRACLGLSTPASWNVIEARLSPHRNIALASSHYIDPAPDWPDGYDLVGFTPWNGPDGGRLDEDVLEFLAAGSPPVIVTLGTSGASARPEIFEAVARVLDELNVRGLFLTSNAAVTRRARSMIAPVHGVWQFVPLAPLLPHARAVVHSGAHGTNALVLEAGLPSVIVPCMFDQLWHARRQQQLGTGLWARHPRHLVKAIHRLLADHVIAEQAARLGVKLRTEDGTAAACDAIEAVCSGSVGRMV
ncbi:MAG: nucleotide disphospho-sugar-binding domain-containing protein [Ilumatobacteraceae bacterium]